MHVCSVVDLMIYYIYTLENSPYVQTGHQLGVSYCIRYGTVPGTLYSVYSNSGDVMICYICASVY